MLFKNPNVGVEFDKNNLREIYFAGGCFWGVEAFLERIYGVYKTTVGYVNGNTENPTYKEVCQGITGFAEAVHITYDATKVTLEELIDQFMRIIDPTSFHKQGEDIGEQYRTGIYYQSDEDKKIALNKLKEYAPKYSKPIVVEVEPFKNYYEAEEDHQKYLEKNPHGYCHVNLNLLNELN